MRFHETSKTRLSSLGAAAVLLVTAARATEATPPALRDTPLFLSTGAEPNIMVMLDNSGSMQNIVPDKPYDPSKTYLASCPSTNTVSTSTQVQLDVTSGGSPRIRYGGTNYVHGTGSGQRCFNPTADYMAQLHDDGSFGYLPAQYTGNYLNWYFSTSTDPTGCSNTWSSGRKPCTQSRMMIARTAGKNLIDSIGANMRVGLSTYNNGNGGRLLDEVEPLTATRRTTLKSTIDGLSPSGNTPLAETLADIGWYFSRGATNLTLHPDTAPQTVSRSNIFSTGGGYTRHSSWSNGSNPIQYSCQKSFAVLLTDGRPQGDRSVSSYLADYDGDCKNANPACLSYDRKPGQEYESEGSDYLDDVAMALYEMDLRPDLVSSQGIKNNVRTYLISFADDQAINDPLMAKTAQQGGGEFFIAGNETELITAFQAALSAIVSQIASAASASVNSGSINTETRVFQARFNSGDWSGELLSWGVNPDGTLDTSRHWDATDPGKIPSYDRREIITVDSSGAAVPFRWSSLDAVRQAQLQPSDALGASRVDYLRGSAAGEIRNGGTFRNRATVLGDIVNSAPAFVGAPAFRYRDNLEAKKYSDFRAKYDTPAERPGVVYVGANDGMLHAFESETGQELFAYVPGAVFANLHHLTNPAYTHRYYVDGSPTVGDAFVNGDWRSVLVAGLNKGGQGIYALDITEPQNVRESSADELVLWEFTDKNDADLGYTFSRPAVVRMYNGKWAAVFGNGYNSTVLDGAASATGNAVLFIVDLESGALVRKIDTGVGMSHPASGGRPNGLATPALVDINGDQIVDFAFAGDLLGNLWKFDLRGSDPAGWRVAYTVGGVPTPLFVAQRAGVRQPITTRPEVTRGPNGLGMMVLFGTGKYLEPSDEIVGNLSPQTFYGILDRNTGTTADIVGSRSDLVEQQITHELVQTFGSFKYGLRVTTDNPLGSMRGWYIDLISPVNGFEGEMQVTDPVIRNGRIIFTTLIPNSEVCGFGGTSWLMEMDAVSGRRLDVTPFDLNGDGQFNSDDFVTLPDGTRVPASGLQPEVGITPRPAVLSGGGSEFKFLPGTTGQMQTIRENPGAGDLGRQSWRQLR